MISIFNGRSRRLGSESKPDIYLQVSVALRQHLHHFKGSKLGVFMAVALHSDQDGWSAPSLALLRQETGYNKETISQAITDLCQLRINGARVLLVVQDRLPNGLMDVNQYLVFPTPTEVEMYEGEDASLLRRPRKKQSNMESPVMVQPRPEKPVSVKPDMVEPDTVKPEVSITRGKKNQTEVEPDRRRNTHTRQRAARASVGVCESRYSLEECRRYAEHLRSAGQGITNPGGYATTIYRTGEADSLIAVFLNPTEISKPRDIQACPDCRGTGFYYPQDATKGVAKCRHTRLSDSLRSQHSASSQEDFSEYVILETSVFEDDLRKE